MECKVTLLLDEDFKSNRQLGYYYGVLVPAAAKGFRHRGNYGVNDEKADYLLRMNFYSETIFDETGHAVTFPMDLSVATKEDVSRVIECCICFITQDLEQLVEPPTTNEKAELFL